MSPTPWNVGEPPRDGRCYVALGAVVGADEWGGSSSPFLSMVRWIKGQTTGWEGWVDERQLAISSDPADAVRIHYWATLPEGCE